MSCVLKVFVIMVVFVLLSTIGPSASAQPVSLAKGVRLMWMSAPPILASTVPLVLISPRATSASVPQASQAPSVPLRRALAIQTLAPTVPCVRTNLVLESTPACAGVVILVKTVTSLLTLALLMATLVKTMPLARALSKAVMSAAVLWDGRDSTVRSTSMIVRKILVS